VQTRRHGDGTVLRRGDLRRHERAAGIDTRSDNLKILLSVHGAMADVYRDQIAYRTKRGLEGGPRNGKPTGGRAYGYILRVTSRPVTPRPVIGSLIRTSRRRASHLRVVRDGKSPRWIAGELNWLGVPSRGASRNRTSPRLNSKRRRGWVATAIHGDTRQDRRSQASDHSWSPAWASIGALC
jgi:hypothetical protein